jgi:autotransporter translocation and assembly factor TamB
LGLEIRNVRNFPIRHENLVSFSGVNVYMPPTSLFMKKKAVSIEIDKPIFVLNDGLLKRKAEGGLGSAFVVHRVRIRDGELNFRGRDIQCQMLNFNLQSGSMAEGMAFRIDSPHLKVTLPISGEPVTLEGSLVGAAHQQGSSWRISQFAWQTREIFFNLNGRVFTDGTYKFNASAQGNPGNMLRPLLGELTVMGLTYADAKIVRNVNGKLQVIADFTSPACRIKENPCSNLAGKLSWNSQSRYLELEAACDTPLARTVVRLGSKNRETSIAVQDLPAAFIARMLDISRDAPLKGIVRRGTLEIDRNFLKGVVELDDAPGHPLSQPFVARGRIDFLRDKKARQSTFSGQRLRFNGGEISISGKTDSRARTTSIRIGAAMKELENMAAYSAYYLGINLLPWKLSGGGGSFELELNRSPGRKRIDSRFRLADFQASRQPIAALQGEVRFTPARTAGDFTISASDLRSKVDLVIEAGKTSFHFREVAGEAKKITRILGMDLDLKGRVAGDFTYCSGRALKEPEVAGRFTAAQLTFLGLALNQVQSSLSSNLQNIHLNGLGFLYKGGRAQGEVGIDFATRHFDLRGRIDDVDVAQLHAEFSGRADLEIDGRGEFLKDPLEISYRLHDMFFYRDRGFSVSGKAKILTDFSDFLLTTSGEVANPAGISPFAIEFGRRGQRYSGSFNFNLMDLDLLIPWKNNAGSMRLIGQIYSGSAGGINSRGVGIFSGRTLSLPNFSHSLDNFQGTVTFVNKSFSLQSVNGEIGGGKVEGNGQLLLDGSGLRSLTFNFQGRDLRLYPMDRASCLVHPDLTLKYEQKRLLLSGTMNFQSVEWQREIDERIVFSTHSELTTAESRIKEMLRLDIAMNSENILMNNSLGRIRGRFALRLTGTASFPILSGTCEGSQGEIYFSGRPFNVLKAKLVFNNKFFIDPLIRIESEAFIQNYRIRFDIHGSASHAKPELAASPPLPTQDILALVSLGELFKRSGSAEVSSQQSSTAMVSAKLTEDIQNRANQLLGINLLRIDPVLPGQSSVDTSRLTIGKTIGKDLIVVYSTNLSTSRQEILYLQYQLSPAISLIAMRNEEGRYSLDLRLRSRR